MRIVTIQTAAASGGSSAVIIDKDIRQSQSVGVEVIVASAQLTTNLQWTLDDPFAVYPASFSANANWINDKNLTNISSGVVAGVPVCTAGFSIPVTAFRLNTTAWTSGSASLTVLQTGGIS